MKETQIEFKIRKQAESRGFKCLKFQILGSRAWPDRIILGSGKRIGFIETKVRNGKPSALQLERHQTLKSLGFEVVVMDEYDQEELSKWLTNL